MANVLGSLLPSIASKRSSSFPALDRNSRYATANEQPSPRPGITSIV
jgi:hypothetical protein